MLALAYDGAPGETVLCVHNLAEEPREVALSVEGAERLESLLDDRDCLGSGAGRFRVGLDAFGYRWYRVGQSVRGRAAL